MHEAEVFAHPCGIECIHRSSQQGKVVNRIPRASADGLPNAVDEFGLRQRGDVIEVVVGDGVTPVAVGEGPAPEGLGLQFQDFHLRHGLQVGVGFLEHGARLGEAVLHLFPLAVLGHDFGKFALRLGDLAVLVRVADDGRVGHLLSELVKAFFELIELRSKMHGEFTR